MRGGIIENPDKVIVDRWRIFVKDKEGNKYLFEIEAHDGIGAGKEEAMEAYSEWVKEAGKEII